MGLRVTEHMLHEIDKDLRMYVEAVKTRSQNNQNSEAVFAEGFFRNLLNLLYHYNLTKDSIENPYTDTIDLHSEENKICVQVTVQNTKAKIGSTIKSFIDKKKHEKYTQLHFMLIAAKQEFDYDINKLASHGVSIHFHDLATIYATLVNKFDSKTLIEPVYNFIKEEFDPNFKRTLDFEPNPENSTVKAEPAHIVDQMYNALKVYEEFECIYPRTVAKLKPFNSSKKISDTYSNFCLKSNNKEIHELLKKVKITSEKQVTSDDTSLQPYLPKLRQIFEKLNSSMINCICYREKYTEIEHHNIDIREEKKNCECNYCTYHKMQISKVFSMVKAKAISPSDKMDEALSEAFYMFKAGEPIKAYQVYSTVLNKSKTEKKSVYNFLTAFNLTKARNFIDSTWWKDEKKSILPVIDAIDLNDMLTTLPVEKSVKEELIKLKEDYFLHYSREQIEESVKSILEIYKLYERRGHQTGPIVVRTIYQELYILTNFYLSNSIIKDDFYGFQETIAKGIEGIIASYATDVRYEYKYKTFDSFILKLILLYISEKRFEHYLSQYNVEELHFSEEGATSFLRLSKNYFESQITGPVLGTLNFNKDLQAQEYFSHYRQNLRHYFNRIFFLLAYSDLKKEKLSTLSGSIVNFLSGAEDINNNNWDYFRAFFSSKAEAFGKSELDKLFQLLFDKHQKSIRTENLISLCRAASNKVQYQIPTKNAFATLFNLILSRLTTNEGRFDKEQLIALYLISDNDGKEVIKSKIIELLSAEFNSYLYEQAVFNGIFKKEDSPIILSQYIKYVQEACTSFDFKNENGEWIGVSFAGINGLACLFRIGIDFNSEGIQSIAKKSEFYNWILNPDTFNYSNFDPVWLSGPVPIFIRKRLKGNSKVKEIIKTRLTVKFDVDLAKLLIEID